MADVTVDRLVVLIEAQTRTFEAQLRKLEGQVAGSSRRMSTAFAAFNTQIRQVGSSLGRAFGFGGVGRGPLAAIVALGYAINKTANSFGDLRKEAMDAGIAIDENILGRGEKFNNEWDRALTSIKIKILGAFGSGSFKEAMKIIDSMFNKPGTGTKVGEATQVSNLAAKSDMLAPSTQSLSKFNDLLAMSSRLLGEFEQKQKNIADAATGVNDAVRDFTFSTLDDFNNIGDAAINLGKTIEKNLIDAFLFGGGPFAGLMGTGANPNAVTQGQPTGLIGGAIQGLFGRTFGNTTGGLTGQPSYNYTGDTTGSGLLSPIGSITSKISSQLFGGGALPAGVTSGGISASTALAQMPMFSGVNNPGNIMYGKFAAGMGATAPASGQLAQFPSTEAGFAAMQQLLMNYQNQGTNTVSSIINRWAPPAAGNLNNTNYAAFVAGNMGVAPSAPLNLANDPTQLQKLMQFMSMFEHGIPMMASGGYLSGGQPALVGERGPELFVPRAPGNIVPNGGMGGVTVYSYGAQVDTQRRDDGGLEIVINKHLKRTLRDSYGIGPKRTGRN